MIWYCQERLLTVTGYQSVRDVRLEDSSERTR